MDSIEYGAYRGNLSVGGPLARLLRYRESLAFLTARALKVRYRRSVLGFGWALLYPLLAMVVLTLVFSHVFPAVPHYALYVVIGVLVWGFFSLSCLQACDALLGGAGILKKVYVPSAIFPLAAVGANLVNLLLSLALLPALMAWLGVTPGLHPLWLATGLVSAVALTIGTALGLAAINMFFHDIRYFFEAMLLLWFYATPIVYPAAVLPDELSILLWMNPFYWILELLRAALYTGTSPAAGAALVAPALGLVVLLGGWGAFTRLERRFYLYL